MSTLSYTENLLVIAGSARNLMMIDIPKMLEQIERAESVGPILDPTLYRSKSKAMSEDKELIAAALPLWRVGQKLKKIADEALARKLKGEA